MQKKTDETQQPPIDRKQTSRNIKIWMIILITIIFLLTLFKACSDKNQSEISTAETSTNTTQTNKNKKMDSSFPVGLHYEKTTNNSQALNLIKRVKIQIAALTNRPETVEFKNLFYLNQNNQIAICGEIKASTANETNNFKRIISNGKQDIALEGQTKGFEQIWDQVCIKK